MRYACNHNRAPGAPLARHGRVRCRLLLAVALAAAGYTGWIGAMPLFGFLKLPQKDSPFSEYPSLQAGWQSWTWKESLPDSVTDRCDFWSRTVRAFPAGLEEYFAVDDGSRSVIVRQVFDYLTTEDAWGTEPLEFAAIPPTLGLALGEEKFPVRFSAPLHDPEMMTPYGPLLGALGVDTLDITYDGLLQYVHEHEKLKAPPAESAVGQIALGQLRTAMAKQFPRADDYTHDHGDESVWCRAIQGYS